MTTNTMTEVVNAIPKLTEDQLKFARDLIERQLREFAPAIKVGDKVTFKPRKTKPAVTGTVVRINGKTCTVENCSDNGPGWRVPPKMLTVIK